MAVITPSAIVGDIRGSIGAVTFARNKSQTVARLKPPPKRTWSTLQLRRRATFQSARLLWQALTEPEQLAWKMAVETLNQLAKRPYPGTLSPYQFFCLVKCSEGMRSYAATGEPPLLVRPCPILVTIPVARYSTRLLLTVYGPYAAASDIVSIQAASPLTKLRAIPPQGAEYRTIGRHPYNTFPRDLFSEFKAVWGQPAYLQCGSLRIVLQPLNRLPSLPYQSDFCWSSD